MIFLKPIVTEKSSDSIKSNIYTFQVPVDMNKDQIAKEVKRLFDVDPMGVRTLMRKGKEKRRGRILGRTSDKKIAFVKLKDDQKIEKIQGLF